MASKFCLSIVQTVTIMLIVQCDMAVANEVLRFEQIVTAFEKAVDQDMKSYSEGNDSSLKTNFRQSMRDLSESELRRAGIEAFILAKDDRKYFQLSALLLDYADFQAAQSWIRIPSRGKAGAEEKQKQRKLAYKVIDSTRAWKGYAAFQAANDLSHKSLDSKALGPAFGYHYIASTAGIQPSYMSLGYLTRQYRLANPDHKELWGLVSSEENYFQNASECTPEQLNDELFPYEKRICDLAMAEANTSDQASDKLIRSGVDKDMAAYFGFLGLVGLAIIENASNNPGSYGNGGFTEIRGPSELEAHLWLNP